MIGESSRTHTPRFRLDLGLVDLDLDLGSLVHIPAEH